MLEIGEGGSGLRRALLLAAAAFVVYLAALAWLYRGLVMDDAYIGLRYVANLLAGYGLTFNPAVRVEGLSNVGWVLLLAPIARMAGPPLAAKLLGFLLAVVAVTLAAAAPARLSRAYLNLRLARANLDLRLARADLDPRPGRAEPGLRLAPWVTVLLAMASAELAAFSLLGMETGALAAALAAMVVLAGRRRGVAWLPPLGAFAFLLHPEAVLVYPLGILLAWRSRALSLRDLLRGGAAYAGCLLLIEAARWSYFGALLPNTFAAKPGGPLAALRHLPALLGGSLVNVGFPFAGLFALPLLALGYLAWRRAEPLPAAFAAAACSTGLLFALYARDDWTGLGRYFAPYAPVAAALLAAGLAWAEREAIEKPGGLVRRVSLLLAAVLVLLAVGAGLVLRADGRELRAAAGAFAWIPLVWIWCGVVELQRRWQRTERADSRHARAAGLASDPRAARPVGMAGLAVALVAGLWGAAGAARLATGAERLAYPGYVITGAGLVPPARWMRDHLPAGGVVASRRIGALSYYSEHPVFDYAFGLTEPAVARRVRLEGGAPFETPSAPALADLWRERRPDFLVEDRDVLHAIAAAAGGTPRCFRVHGLAYGELRRFPIGDRVEWALAGRHAGSLDCPDALPAR
jgi:hypothetical protein